MKVRVCNSTRKQTASFLYMSYSTARLILQAVLLKRV